MDDDEGIEQRGRRRAKVSSTESSQDFPFLLGMGQNPLGASLDPTAPEAVALTPSADLVHVHSMQ